MKIDYQIQGSAELLAKLKALGGDVDRAVEQGLIQGAKTVQASAKQLCPVDTGTLRNSIVTQKEEKHAVAVTTNLEYAPYVEFGTGSKGDPSMPHTSKDRWVYQNDKGQFFITSGQSPQPFLTPALRLCENAVKKRFEAAIKKAIKERGSGR